ncbi:hypothetical protein Hanom_Chr13g01198281 [Helianthus anomalus]
MTWTLMCKKEFVHYVDNDVNIDMKKNIFYILFIYTHIYIYICIIHTLTIFTTTNPPPHCHHNHHHNHPSPITCSDHHLPQLHQLTTSISIPKTPNLQPSQL